MWARKNEDVSAPKQAWYCCMCGCRYSSNDGMLVEFHKNGMSYWMQAECPNKSMEDIKNMAMEVSKKYKKSIAAGPLALYNEIPDVKPMDITSFLRQAKEAEVSRHDYKGPEFDIQYFWKFLDVSMMKLPETDPRSIPKWKWECIVELFRANI